MEAFGWCQQETICCILYIKLPLPGTVHLGINKEFYLCKFTNSKGFRVVEMASITDMQLW
jgi:hypothetical protein